MKKTLTILLCCFCCALFAQQSSLPTPFLRYSCESIGINHFEMTPDEGSIVAVVTDGQGATSYKTDAAIENDPQRGNVLFLPNTVDANGKGDAAAYYRSLRIISSSSLVGTGDFTISFWEKVKAQTTFNAFPAVLDFDGMSNGRSFSMRNSAWWNSSKPSLRFNDGSNKDLNINLDPNSFIYNWTHYVITKQGTTIKLYVNTILRASNTTYNLANSELKQFRLNGQAHGGGSLLDDIQIFQQALNSEQILELYSGKPLYHQPLGSFEHSVNDSLALGTKWYEPTLFSVVPQIGVNPSKTLPNLSDSCYTATIVSNAWWGNFGELKLKTPIQITENNRYLKFKAYRSSQYFNFRVAVNGDHEKEVYQGKLSQNGIWEDVVVDLGSQLLDKQLTSIVFLFSCNWGTAAAETSVQGFDDFELLYKAEPISVSTAVYPLDGGGVTGSGSYQPGADLTLSATPNSGYTFAGWFLNGVLVSANSTYTVPLTLTTDKSLSYIAFFKKESENFPSLTVSGNYFEIEDLETNKRIFRNRDFEIQGIPDDFAGWKYLQVSARSDYNPIGNPEPPVYSLVPSSSGTIYAMVADHEQPANVSLWASSQGWERVPVYSSSYGVDDPNKVLSFFKKEFAAGQEVSIMFPDVFSRATIIAPDIERPTTTIRNSSENRTVAYQQVFTLSGADVFSSISELPNGIYIVKTVFSNGDLEKRKIVVCKK